MPIIGSSVTGAANASFNTGFYSRCYVGSSFAYTAVSGDTVTDVNWYGWCDTSTGTIVIGVYDITTTGVNNNPANAATSLVLSATVAVAGSSDALWTTTLGSPFALTAGRVYAVAAGHNQTREVQGYSQSNANSYFQNSTAGALPNPWSGTHGGIQGTYFCVYATVVSAPAGGIAPRVHHRAQMAQARDKRAFHGTTQWKRRGASSILTRDIGELLRAA